MAEDNNEKPVVSRLVKLSFLQPISEEKASKEERQGTWDKALELMSDLFDNVKVESVSRYLMIDGKRKVEKLESARVR